MQNVNAQQGLLISWGGLEKTVDPETVSQFSMSEACSIPPGSVKTLFD